MIRTSNADWPRTPNSSDPNIWCTCSYGFVRNTDGLYNLTSLNSLASVALPRLLILFLSAICHHLTYLMRYEIKVLYLMLAIVRWEQVKRLLTETPSSFLILLSMSFPTLIRGWVAYALDYDLDRRSQVAARSMGGGKCIL